MPFINRKYRKGYFNRLPKTQRRQRSTGNRLQSSDDQSNARHPLYEPNPNHLPQPVPQTATMPSAAFPSFSFQQMISDRQFTQFRQFEDQIHARSFHNFERFMLSQQRPPPNMQPAVYTSHHPQAHQHGQAQFVAEALPMADPCHQPAPEKHDHQDLSKMAGTSCCGEDGALTSHPLSTPTQEALGSGPGVEPSLKRKLTNPIPEILKSSKPRNAAILECKTKNNQTSPDGRHSNAESEVKHAASLNSNSVALSGFRTPSSYNEHENIIAQSETLIQRYPNIKLTSASIAIEDTFPYMGLRNNRITELSFTDESSSTTFSTTPNQGDTTESSMTSIQNYSEAMSLHTHTPGSSNTTSECNEDQAPSTSLSREDMNRLSLSCTIELAESKFDDPNWRDGVLLDDFAIVLKQHFTDLKPPTWYSYQTLLAWRASLTIPFNWIVVLHDEDPMRHALSRETTDIVQVRHEKKRSHWTTVHLSIKDWMATYYDSYLGQSKEDDDLNMEKNCAELVKTVRSRYPKHGITLPSRDPTKTAKCTIKQTDFCSCGPFALREVEKLIGLKVDDDQECPIAIRCRHAKSILNAVSKRMNELRTQFTLPAKDNVLEIGGKATVDSYTSEWADRTTPGDIDVPSELQDVVWISSNEPYLAPLSQKGSSATEASTKAESAKGQSKAPRRNKQTTTAKSSGAQVNEKTAVKASQGAHAESKRRSPQVRPRDLGHTDPYPQLPSTRVEGQEVTIDQDITKGKKCVPRMLRELESNFNAAPPKRRPKPRYSNRYRMPLPGVEDGDISTVNEDSSDGSDGLTDTSSDSEQSSSSDGSFDGSGLEKSNGVDDDEILAASEERPSEEVIAKLSLAQRRQALMSVSLREFRRIGAIGCQTKGECIDHWLEYNLLIPDTASWRFLKKSIYVGWSKEAITNETKTNLRKECVRLGIAHGTSKPKLAHKILSFIETGGIIGKPWKESGGPESPFGALLEQYTKRGLDLPPKRPFGKYQALLDRYDEKEKERMTLSRDPNLPSLRVESCRSVIVIIDSRQSAGTTKQSREKLQIERDDIERILRTGQIISGLEEATYLHSHRVKVSLSAALSESKTAHIRKAMRDAKDGTQIMLVSLGVDGFSCNESVWEAFILDFSTRLQLSLLVVESRKQWHESAILWSHDDWLGPIENRYWACCDWVGLFNAERDVRLYRQIREQWFKCDKGRSMRREAISAEGRPIIGRNGR